jgi:hypothetical protein
MRGLSGKIPRFEARLLELVTQAAPPTRTYARKAPRSTFVLELVTPLGGGLSVRTDAVHTPLTIALFVRDLEQSGDC